MTDTTDQLALTSAFMRPYIALARKLADTVARTALVCAIAADENLDPILEPGAKQSVSERRAA